jgi:cytochrome P450
VTATEPLVFDPYDYAFHEDPYPLYARLRDEAPLYHNAERGFWALSRHTDVMESFRDTTRFSSAEGVSLDPAACGPHAYKTMSFLAMDPPRHGRMRSLVSRGFTPRRVAELEPRIRELTRHYLGLAVEKGEFDFVADFAGKLPMDVISELMGVPESDRDELRRLADLLVHREEGVLDVPPAGIDAAFTLAGYYADMISDRRRRRTDDLTSALIDAEIDGDRLSDEEIMAFLFLMVVAGNETTTKLLSNAWYWSWRFPDQRDLVVGDPGSIPGWIEETLRFDTSSQLLARVVTEDVALHGGVVPAGDRIVLLAGSANRDQRVFADPDVYDVRRFGRDGSGSQGQLASFGMGRHFCMGAPLARLEGQIALTALARRLVNPRLVDDPPPYRRNAVLRGPLHLPVGFERLRD